MFTGIVEELGHVVALEPGAASARLTVAGPLVTSDATHGALLRFAQAALRDAGAQTWKREQYPVLLENALRQLIAVSPDLQTA